MMRHRVFLMGFALGSGASLVLLLSGIGEVFFTPLWQRLAFYPGLLAGWAFYDCCERWFATSGHAEIASKAIGILAVGVAYGLVAQGLASAAAAIVSRRASPRGTRSH